MSNQTPEEYAFPPTCGSVYHQTKSGFCPFCEQATRVEVVHSQKPASKSWWALARVLDDLPSGERETDERRRGARCAECGTGSLGVCWEPHGGPILVHFPHPTCDKHHEFVAPVEAGEVPVDDYREQNNKIRAAWNEWRSRNKGARADAFPEFVGGYLAGRRVTPPVGETPSPDNAGVEEHTVEFSEDGWSIQHPPRCRPNLLDCHANEVMRGWSTTAVEEELSHGLGRYTLTESEGGWEFTPVEDAPLHGTPTAIEMDGPLMAMLDESLAEVAAGAPMVPREEVRARLSKLQEAISAQEADAGSLSGVLGELAGSVEREARRDEGAQASTPHGEATVDAPPPETAATRAENAQVGIAPDPPRTSPEWVRVGEMESGWLHDPVVARYERAVNDDGGWQAHILPVTLEAAIARAAIEEFKNASQ